ncbi:MULTISPECIES: hypothetical protein [Burkholderia]|uniref:hypothetical protein n=1 Tax=Burkholderia TaxID=32008 RepID=UPI000B212F61|nr:MULTISPECIES: hypothetical protein [Burkholderia]MBO7810197.1 hypothetical protein [Burkholderia pseudomallei]
MMASVSIYKLVLKIPVVGSAVYITNSYVLRGDSSALDRFASPVQWAKVFFFPWLWAAILTAVTAPNLTVNLLHLAKICSLSATSLETKGGEFITTIFPNLLGFGIGVYALIFAISETFLRRIDSHITKRKQEGARRFGSALMFNADLAYPLLAMVVTLIVGVLQQAYPTVRSIQLAAWFFFWYSMVTLIEIIAVLFGLGEHEILEKIDSDDTPQT